MPSNDAHFSGEGHLIEAVIFGDTNKTVIPVVCDSNGKLLVDLDASSITIGKVDIQDTNGAPLLSTAGSLNTNVANFPVNQNVTVTNGAGAAAVNIQDGGNSITVDGTVTTLPSGTQNVSLVATSVTQPVSGTVIANQGTTPWTISGSVTNTPPANQSVNLTQVGGAAISEGQKPSATSIPVVIASDQSALPVTGTFFQAVQPITRVGATLNTNQISVGSTSTLILAANANRKRLVLINMGTTNVFIGNIGVTIGTGQLLLGIAGYIIPLYFTGAVYGIVGTGTQTIAYLEEAV